MSRLSEVFTPGGVPTITYVSRQTADLERELARAKNNLNKLIVLTGATKSGKTVLVDRVFPRNDNVWIDGGTVDSEDIFWDIILNQLDAFTTYSITNGSTSAQELRGGMDVTAGVLPARGTITGQFAVNTANQNNVQQGRQVFVKNAAITALSRSNVALIVDDFHYIENTIQRNIVRALKALIMQGLPVVFVAIPSNKYNVISVEREMTARIKNLEMQVWEKRGLKDIAIKGFNALNINVSEAIIEFMAQEAYGSPFLMQEFCKNLCENKKIDERQGHKITIESSRDEIEQIFKTTAEDMGRDFFEKLKKGPGTGRNRKGRLLKDGSETDSYGLVMEAFKGLKPGVESISLSKLLEKIEDIAVEPPRKNEITNTLNQIAKVAALDTSSTYIVEWDKEKKTITITDPFFAYFLKWSE